MRFWLLVVVRVALAIGLLMVTVLASRMHAFLSAPVLGISLLLYAILSVFLEEWF